MGKGKGKLAGWVAQLSPGVTMFEFKNLRTGRAKYYYEQVAHRLPVDSAFVNLLNLEYLYGQKLHLFHIIYINRIFFYITYYIT